MLLPGSRFANASLVASLACCLFGQAVVGPAFEVASIKPDDPTIPTAGRTQFYPSGRFTAPRITLKALIQLSYAVDDFHISGGPNWLKTALFNLEAKASSPASEEQMKAMIRTVLADRFKLKVHRETQEVSVYALVVEKAGPKIQPLKDASGPSSKNGFGVGTGTLTANRVSLASLALVLSRLLGRPVFDRTGLRGTYDFKLEHDQSSVKEAMVGLGNVPSEGASIFTAVRETLGLRLNPEKNPMDILIIDSAERPSDN